MRRPFAVIGFTFFVTLFALNLLPLYAVWIVTAISVAGCLAAFAVRRLRREAVLQCALIAVFAACVTMAVALHAEWKPVQAMDAQTVTVTAHTADLPYRTDDGRYRCLLRTDSIDAQPMRCKVVLYTDELPCDDLTDRLSFRAKLYAVSSPPGDGICFLVYRTEDMTVSTDVPTLLSRVLSIRRYVTRTMRQTLPGTPGAVLTAMLLGDSSAIPDVTYMNMRRSGILHIFSISGFHLSVFAVLLLHFLEKRRVSRFIYVPLCAAMVLFVTAVTGFPLSCCRAGIMVGLMLVGKLFTRRTDALNSLGLAVLLMSLQNPFCAGEVGLQLSVLGTLGVVTSVPYIERLTSRICVPFVPAQNVLRLACTTALVSAYVTLLTMPITVFAFGTVSLIAPVTNALIMFAAQWALILASCGVLLSLHPLLTAVFRPVMLFSGRLARYCVAVSDFCGKRTFASLRVDVPSAGLWIAGTLLLIAVSILLRMPQRRKIVLTAMLSVLLLVVPALVQAWSVYDTARVTVLDAGDNAAVLVKNSGHTALIGCGGQGVARAVTAQTDRLDWLLLPYLSSSVSGGADRVLQSVHTQHIYVPQRSAAAAPLVLAYSPEMIPSADLPIGNGVSAAVLTDPNAPAVLLRLYSRTMLMVFMPGCELSALPQEWLNADYLYVRGDVPPSLSAERYGFVMVQTDGARSAYILSSIAADGGEAMGAGTVYFDRGGGIRIRPQ